MNTETDYLKSIAEEIIHSAAITTEKPNNHLQVEAKRLEKAIIHSLNSIENFTQRDTFHFNTLSKLVNICDLLFEQTSSVNPNVSILIELITSVKQTVPSEIRPNLKLPKAFVEMQRSSFAEIWQRHEGVLKAQEVEPKLIEIAAIPFKRFIDGKQKLYWGDFTWLRGYETKLDIIDWDNADCNSKTEALISLLIGRNFNDDRFYIYCKKYIQSRTGAISGKRNRLLEFAHCEKLVLEDTQVGTPAFDLRANSVSVRLLKWVKEEIDFVETHERERPHSKFEFKWNVEMIAFFFKLLYDHKVLDKVTLEKLSEQIASNCASKGRDELTPGSVFSKFYVKEPVITEPMAKLLEELLNDVNRFRG